MAGTFSCKEKFFPPPCFTSANRFKSRNLSFVTPIQASNSSVTGSFQPKDFRFDSKVENILDNMKWDEKGLAMVIAKNVDTGAILMQGFANREALGTTITSRKATFYSPSRSSVWTKGETSMNFINVHDIFIDSDRDSIIYLVKPDGPACHTGEETCYYTSTDDLLDDAKTNKVHSASTTCTL